MTNHQKKNPGGNRGFDMSTGKRTHHIRHASADALLQRLNGVVKSGNGWRARCPLCDGLSRKVAIAECDDKVMLICFADVSHEHKTAILSAVGLTWGDLFPPRYWPDSPEERRKAMRAIRDAGMKPAIDEVAHEAHVVLQLWKKIRHWQHLTDEEDARLDLAVERIFNAKITLSNK